MKKQLLAVWTLKAWRQALLPDLFQRGALPTWEENTGFPFIVRHNTTKEQCELQQQQLQQHSRFLVTSFPPFRHFLATVN